jgi:hypothetical protein
MHVLFVIKDTNLIDWKPRIVDERHELRTNLTLRAQDPIDERRIRHFAVDALFHIEQLGGGCLMALGNELKQ